MKRFLSKIAVLAACVIVSFGVVTPVSAAEPVHSACPYSTPAVLDISRSRTTFFPGGLAVHWSTVERVSSGSNFFSRVQVNASSYFGSFFARAEMHSGGRMVTADSDQWVSGARGNAVTATSNSPTTSIAGTARGFFGN